VLGAGPTLPATVDLRAPWWTINSQESTGSCVGWATADGLVRYHLVKAGRLPETMMLSPRYVWMASKETDAITGRPETFIEQAGTTLKAAIDVVRKYGAALQTDLRFHIATNMFAGDENTFYAGCAQRRIASYFNLGRNLTNWKTWLADQGPILAALQVDASWYAATTNAGRVDIFQPATVVGGHAVCIVGYGTDGRFIVRNSWGTAWATPASATSHRTTSTRPSSTSPTGSPPNASYSRFLQLWSSEAVCGWAYPAWPLGWCCCW
jgi:C1A family cysteine protease